MGFFVYLGRKLKWKWAPKVILFRHYLDIYLELSGFQRKPEDFFFFWLNKPHSVRLNKESCYYNIVCCLLLSLIFYLIWKVFLCSLVAEHTSSCGNKKRQKKTWSQGTHSHTVYSVYSWELEVSWKASVLFQQGLPTSCLPFSWYLKNNHLLCDTVRWGNIRLWKSSWGAWWGRWGSDRGWQAGWWGGGFRW